MDVMTVCGLMAWAVLFGYLLWCQWRYGDVEMVSDTYYALERDGGRGWLFSMVMLGLVLLVLPPLLDAGEGWLWLAFVGCMGLGFMALAPAYRREDERDVHRWGAVTAAAGCVGWCLTVCPLLPVAAVAVWLLVGRGRWWYWAEVCAFLCMFVGWVLVAC